MPRYTYKCDVCGTEDVILRKYSERDLPAKCRVCNNNLCRSAVEVFAISKNLGDGGLPKQPRGGVGMRLAPGAQNTGLFNCEFSGFGVGLKAEEGSSFTSRGDRFNDCDVAYDIDGAEFDISDTEIE